MRIILLFFISLGCNNAFACSDAMKPFTFECKAQDRFELLSTGFKTYSTNMSDLKGFKIPKAIGKSSYYFAKNDLLNHSEFTLSRNLDWLVWNNGQKFINNLSSVYIEFKDILKLHNALFASKGLIIVGPEAGKLRSDSGETNPKVSMSCSDKVLNGKLFNTLFDYDLQSVEDFPLLTLENIILCKDTNYYSADLYFYKGASIKIEITRWMQDINDMLARYENGNAQTDLSPYNYFSDMRRWFLAIKPFNAGNEQVVDALLDYSTKRLQLPPLELNDLVTPIYLTVRENRDATVNKLKETLDFFEGCLFETKTKLISSECSAIK
ncbi:MAG: hypothetical protein H7281_10145 [Bacteriovorax sp.]|nr:hypothetical protein [Bacteriovorax sp.]